MNIHKVYIKLINSKLSRYCSEIPPVLLGRWIVELKLQPAQGLEGGPKSPSRKQVHLRTHGWRTLYMVVDETL